MIERFTPTTTHIGNNMVLPEMEPDPSGEWVHMPNDGRPMHADAFFAETLAHIDDHYDRMEAQKAWIEGDWAEATDILNEYKADRGH